MAPKVPSTNFSRSPLVRALADLAGAAAAPTRQPLADQLGQWLGWADAISLSAALNAPAAAPSKDPGGRRPPLRLEIAAELARLRMELARAITSDELLAPGQRRAKAGSPALDAPVDMPVDFAPYRRSCQTHQRAMESAIGALRIKVRSALEQASSRLGQLAALDAVMEGVLAPRERGLLAQVPSMLERRLEGWRQAGAAPGRVDASSPPAWLTACCFDLQNLLLAELDMRLQPLEGMLDALAVAPPASVV